MGEALAKEHPVDADVVIGVPDAAIPASIGYAKESKIDYAEGLIRNRYVGRTFIYPDQRLRELGVRTKFNVLKNVIENKKIILVDDSIVRGTTTSRVLQLLRDAGAAEVHMRVSSPPIISPCYFGVDMATNEELIANNFDVENISSENVNSIFLDKNNFFWISTPEGLNRYDGDINSIFKSNPFEMLQMYGK